MAVEQLDVVVRLAREQRDAAAQRLAEAQQRFADMNGQLQQLVSYQAQYAQQTSNDATRGISVQTLADSRRFIGELDGVITAQRERVQGCQREVDGFIASWADATRYLTSIEQLVALRRSEQEQRRIRAEQRQADELYAQQMYRR